MSVGWQPEVQSVFQSCGYAEIVHGGAGIVHSEIGRQLSPEDVYRNRAQNDIE